TGSWSGRSTAGGGVRAVPVPAADVFALMTAFSSALGPGCSCGPGSGWSGWDALLPEHRIDAAPQDRIAVGLRDRKLAHGLDAVEHAHVERVVAPEHDVRGAVSLDEPFQGRVEMQDG